jgi:hypothetical protein
MIYNSSYDKQLNGVSAMKTKNNKPLEIRFSNLDKETIDIFDKIKTDKYSGDKKKAFDGLLNNHKLFNFKLSDEENLLLIDINNTIPDLFEKKIKHLIASLADKLKNTDYSKASLTVKNSSKSAFLRTEKMIDELMIKNDSVKEWFERKYINQKTVFDYAKEKKKVEPSFLAVSNKTVRQYLAINKQKIEDHNKKYDMAEDHNLKVHYFKLKQSKV